MIPNYTKFPLPGRLYDYCTGPENYGFAQDSEFADRWALWVAPDGVRIGKRAKTYSQDYYGIVFPLSIAAYGKKYLSFSFDYTGFATVAASTDDQITIYSDDGEDGNTYGPFDGTSALMWFDGLLQRDETLQDMVCIYLKRGINAIFGRFQRDSYSIEYQLFETPFYPRWLQKCDVSDFWFLKLWGRTTEEKQFEIKSHFYQPKPLVITAETLVNASVDNILYFPAIANGGTFIGSASVNGIIASIEHNETVIFGGTFTGSISVTAQADSITYFEAIISGGTFTGSTAVTGQADSITYTEVVADGGTFTGTTAVSGALQSIEYTT